MDLSDREKKRSKEVKRERRREGVREQREKEVKLGKGGRILVAKWDFGKFVPRGSKDKERPVCLSSLEVRIGKI